VGRGLKCSLSCRAVRNRTLPSARERPDITLFIEFPTTYQWAGSGNQLATSKGAWGAILTVECAAGNHEAAVFSSGFDLPAVVAHGQI
jgi:hypothetical protein